MFEIALSKDTWKLKYRYNDESENDFYARPYKGLFADLQQEYIDKYCSLLGITSKEKLEETITGYFREHMCMLAGRPMYSLGTGRKQQTLSNCYVVPITQDSMVGIMKAVSDAAETMRAGGGVGYNFSVLRPKNALIKTSGANSTGPLSFMRIFNTTCGTIAAGGNRRGAQIAILGVWHPDIKQFITCKRGTETIPEELRPYKNFNLSVMVSDDFMLAVEEDKEWKLMFPDTSFDKYDSEWDGNIKEWIAKGYPVDVYDTVRARDLWDTIIKSTYDFAEPGVLFEDTINRNNTLWMDEYILACNPCVTADTFVMTAEGPRQVKDLIGKQFTALVDGDEYLTSKEGFFSSGVKQVYRLHTSLGYSIKLTADHKVFVRTEDGKIRKVKAKDLKVGDSIILHNHGGDLFWEGEYTYPEGYLIGLLVGDGAIKDDKAVLSIWGTSDGVEGIKREALQCALTLPHRKDFKGWQKPINGTGEQRLVLGYLKNVAFDLGMSKGNKVLTPELEKCSSEFYRGFLKGLFDADGSVQGSKTKGYSVRLSQSSLSCLQIVQRMLHRLGIVSVLYKDRRPQHTKTLPNGRGGTAQYDCAAQHELVITKENLSLFYNRIGFSDTVKQSKLEKVVSDVKFHKEPFITKFEKLEKLGVEEVYDVSVPGPNAFDANALMISNCGEQPLIANGSCNLGSVNLARHVKNIFKEDAYFDFDTFKKVVRAMVVMLDRMLDINHYPLKEQKEVVLQKRQIGLGITGLGDMFALLRMKYSSEEAQSLFERIMRTLREEAFSTSNELAKLFGAFPLWGKSDDKFKDDFVSGPYVGTLPKELLSTIRKHGLRNSRLLSIAPTGTISLIMNNASSGIEPIYQLEYERKIKITAEEHVTELVEAYSWRKYKEFMGDKNISKPDFFETTDDLTVDAHLGIQSIAQRYICTAISKTINIPVDYSFEDFKDVYIKAHRLGLKGCTTYRPNDVVGYVLAKKGTSRCEDNKRPKMITHVCAPKRPKELPCNIHHCTVKGESWLVLVGMLENEPYEIFAGESEELYIPKSCKCGTLIKKNGGKYSLAIKIKNSDVEYKDVANTLMTTEQRSLTRLISLSMRHGVPLEFIQEQLKKANGDITDFSTVVARVLGSYIKEYKYSKNTMCPNCGDSKLVRSEGCMSCPNCGYSKCG